MSGDEKSLASKLVWKGKSWPKVAVGGKGFSCVLGVKVRWFFSCYLGSLDPIFVVQASFARSFCVASTDYQRFLASLKLMTSQVVQIAGQLTGRICPVVAQRVKMFYTILQASEISEGSRNSRSYNANFTHGVAEKRFTPFTLIFILPTHVRTLSARELGILTCVGFIYGVRRLANRYYQKYQSGDPAADRRRREYATSRESAGMLNQANRTLQ